MASPAPGTIPGYDFSEPTAEDACASLVRIFGPQAGPEHWARACRSADLDPDDVRAGTELARAAAALASAGGAVAMVGRSIEIRMRTYARLAQSGRATPAGGEG